MFVILIRDFSSPKKVVGRLHYMLVCELFHRSLTVFSSSSSRLKCVALKPMKALAHPCRHLATFFSMTVRNNRNRMKTVNDVVALNSFSFLFLPAADYMPRAEISKKINRDKCQVQASKAEKKLWWIFYNFSSSKFSIYIQFNALQEESAQMNRELRPQYEEEVICGRINGQSFCYDCRSFHAWQSWEDTRFSAFNCEWGKLSLTV